MELSEEQYARIKDCLPRQRGNVSIDNLRLLNALLYVLENRCSQRSDAPPGRELLRQFGRVPVRYCRLLMDCAYEGNEARALAAHSATCPSCH